MIHPSVYSLDSVHEEKWYTLRGTAWEENYFTLNVPLRLSRDDRSHRALQESHCMMQKQRPLFPVKPISVSLSPGYNFREKMKPNVATDQKKGNPCLFLRCLMFIINIGILHSYSKFLFIVLLFLERVFCEIFKIGKKKQLKNWLHTLLDINSDK